MLKQSDPDAMRQRLAAKYPKIFDQGRGATLPEPGWYYIIDALCANIQNHIDTTRKARARALLGQRAVARLLKGNDRLIRRWMNMPDSVWLNERIEEYRTGKSVVMPTDDPCPQVVVTQIKEKWGSLRFYYYGGDSAVANFVTMAESMSSRTCGNCGAVGFISTGGWMQARCAPCRLGFTQTVPFYPDEQETENDS